MTAARAGSIEARHASSRCGAGARCRRLRRRARAGGRGPPGARLDQQVGPLRVGGVGREVEPLHDGRRREREIALRVRRNGPHPVAPRVDAERLDPFGARRGQVVGHVLAATEREEARAELAAVEPVPPAVGDRRQRPRHPGAADHGAGLNGRRRSVVVGAGQVEHLARGPGVDRRGGKAVGRVVPCGFEHLGHRQPPEALVQGEPSVDAAGNGHAADVASHRHGGEAVGSHALRVGARTGAPGGVQDRGRAACRGRSRRGRRPCRTCAASSPRAPRWPRWPRRPRCLRRAGSRRRPRWRDGRRCTPCPKARSG